jgi:hypothetical protein
MVIEEVYDHSQSERLKDKLKLETMKSLRIDFVKYQIEFYYIQSYVTNAENIKKIFN